MKKYLPLIMGILLIGLASAADYTQASNKIYECGNITEAGSYYLNQSFSALGDCLHLTPEKFMQLSEYYSAGDNSYESISVPLLAAQTYTASSSYTIGRIDLKLASTDPSQVGNITVSLKTLDGFGLPTGSAVSSGTYNGSVITGSPAGAWYEINMSSYAVSSATKYAIVVEIDGGGELLWFMDTSSPTYAGGEYQLYNGGWSKDDTVDFMFEVYKSISDVSINCTGYTITGNSTGIAINSTATGSDENHTIPFPLTIQNCIVTNFTLSVKSNGAINVMSIGNGGEVSITNSSLEDLENRGVSGTYAGSAGIFRITNSTVFNINSTGGDGTLGVGGIGGSVNVTNSITKNIYAFGGVANNGGGAGGTVYIDSNSFINGNIFSEGHDGINSASDGGIGGFVSVINSTFNGTKISVISGQYAAGGPTGYTGGDILFSNALLNVSRITFNLTGGFGGAGAGGYGPHGNLTLNYSTYFEDTLTNYGTFLRLKLINSSAGQIEWYHENLTGSLLKLAGNFSISNRFAELKSESIPELNRSAIISFFNIPALLSAMILRDGIECNSSTSPSCNNFTALSNTTVVFNVSSWTNYTLAGSEILPDTTPPNLSFITPVNGGNYTTSSIIVNITNSSATNVWYWNGTGNTTYNTAAQTINLPDGNYLFTAWANDSAGNINSTTTNFTIDTVFPQFSNYWDDSGAYVPSASNFNVTVTKTNFTVWLEINNTNLSATRIGNVYSVSYAFTSGGAYSYTWWAYGNGTLHNINNSGINSRTYTMNQDAVSPTAYIISPLNGTYLSDLPTIYGYAEDDVRIDYVFYQLKNSTAADWVNITGCNISYPGPYNCPWNTLSYTDLELYQVRIVPVDTSGNINWFTEPFTYGIDRTRPYVWTQAIIYPTGQTSARNGQNITLRLNATDSPYVSAGLDYIQIYTNGLDGNGYRNMSVVYGNSSSGVTSTWELNVTISRATSALPVSSPGAQVFAYDNATPIKNVRDSETYYPYIDNDAPLPISWSTTPTNPVNGTLTNFTITAYDNFKLKQATLFYNLNGTLLNQTISLTGITATAQTNYTVYNGTWSYYWTVEDDAGNKYTMATQTVYGTLPGVNLSISLITPPDGYEQDNLTMNFSYNYTGTATASFCDLIIGSTLWGREFSPINDTTLFFNNITLLAYGTYTWYIRCTDTVGNIYVSETRTFRLNDTQAPSITILTPTEGQDFTNFISSITIPSSFIAIDTNLDSCWYSIDYQPNVSVSCTNAVVEWFNMDITSTGSHFLVVWANDSTGNQMWDNVTFTVSTYSGPTGGIGGEDERLRVSESALCNETFTFIMAHNGRLTYSDEELLNLSQMVSIKWDIIFSVGNARDYTSNFQTYCQESIPTVSEVPTPTWLEKIWEFIKWLASKLYPTNLYIGLLLLLLIILAIIFRDRLEEYIHFKEDWR